MSNSSAVSIQNIRLAKPEDAPAIAGLILELAAFEKLESQAALDVEKLEALIKAFDPNLPVAFISVVEYEGALIGFALCCFKYSTFLTDYYIYLEDLYVKEKYRKGGIGMALIEIIARYANGAGIKRFDFEVLKWNPAVAFYEKLGFVGRNDWLPMRLEGETLCELPGKLMAARIAKASQ